jgi:hypothetical protein
LRHTARASDQNPLPPPSKPTPAAQLLEERLLEYDIQLPSPPEVGHTQRLTCPECGNGSRGEDSFAVTVLDDCALWCCHRRVAAQP